MIKDFKGKVAVVTGGGHGIGFSFAENFLKQGMKVILTASRQSSVDEAVSKLGGGNNLIGIASDAGNKEAVFELAKLAEEQFGKVNLLCLNAGISGISSIQDMELEQWDRHININLNGVFWGVKAFLPLLEKEDEAHIVVTSSIFSFVSNAMQAPYFATKAGISAFAEALYYDLMAAESKVGVTLLCPGNTSTNMANANVPEDADPEFAEAIKAELAQGTPPQEISEKTIQAIKDNQFYLLPNTGVFQAAVDARFERAMSQRNPSWDDVGGVM